MAKQPHHHHAVAAHGQRQQQSAARFLADVEAQIRAAYDDAEQRIVAPVVAAYVAAYRVEYERVTTQLRDASEDGQTVDLAACAVQLRHWLIVSGWRSRVTAAYQTAAHEAGQRSLAAVRQAQGPARALGTQHARMLLYIAMQPAIHAGMDWRPKL